MQRYDRESWLETALEVLAEKGGAAIRIDALAASLRVTKGSFYHHFRNRAEFVEALGDHWSKQYTDVVVNRIGKPDGDGRERLWKLMKLVWSQELDRFDIAFRSWAAKESSAARIVGKVDAERYRFIKSLFEDMGFTGTELEARVRIWLVFSASRRTLHLPDASRRTEPSLEDYFNFFVS